MEFWVWVSAATVLGFLWWKKMKKKIETKNQGVPKGNLGWPLIGETLDFIASGSSSRPVVFMDKRKSLYGEVFKTHILGTPIIVSTDPDVNKVVLQNHGNIFIPAYPKSVRELLGKYSILQTNGNLQKKLHALTGGFLRSSQLKRSITRDIEDSVKLTLAEWKNMNPILVQNETRKITFKVLVKVLMSVGPGEDLEFLKKEFEEFIKGLICIPIKLPGTQLHKSLKAKDKILNFVRKLVEERRSASEDDTGVKDTIDLLLHDNGDSQDSQWLSPEMIGDNIIEMMIPGEETVPTAMTLAVKFLADNPDALEKLKRWERERELGSSVKSWVREENLWACDIDWTAVKGGPRLNWEENMELKKQKAETNDSYEWSDYMFLPFTQNVISETLRMANIINGVWRKAQKDVHIKNYLIPEGWCVLTSFSSVHMDEDKYQNPYQFDPWRWEKIGTTANNINFTPFGGGQRLCPGLELSRLEIAIFLHHLVSTYRWAAEEDEIVYFPTVKMKKKLPITVTPITS